MVNFDQAEGLRRMLFRAKPRFVTLLTTLESDEKNSTLVNLCAGIGRLGHDVVLLDARQQGSGPAYWLGQKLNANLLDVARGKSSLQQAMLPTHHGFRLASLCRYQNGSTKIPASQPVLTKLNRAVETLGNAVDIVIADAELSDTGRLPSRALEQGEIVIQVTNRTDSIKTAYSLIKRANHQFGQQEFGLLVNGVNEFDARRIYDAMANAANNFLSVSIDFFGYVPQDDYLQRASRSGKSVIDAFPNAGASMAFSRLAQQMTNCSDFAIST